jgi:hypothetical protein
MDLIVLGLEISILEDASDDSGQCQPAAETAQSKPGIL